MSSPVKLPDLKGLKRARVLTVDDPEKHGRIGVFIPSVMAMLDTGSKETKEKVSPKEAKVAQDFNRVMSSSPLDVQNFIWAKPIHKFFRNASNKVSGDFDIPKVGSIVYVHFEEEDPQKLFYFPFGPDDTDDSVDLTKTDSPNTDDANKRTNIHILASTPGGTVIAIEENTEDIILKTAKGTKIVVLNDGTVEIGSEVINLTAKNINITATENVVVKADKAIEITAASDVTVNGSGAIPWKPNGVAVCPFAGFDHSVGITTLKGKG